MQVCALGQDAARRAQELLQGDPSELRELLELAGVLQPAAEGSALSLAAYNRHFVDIAHTSGVVVMRGRTCVPAAALRCMPAASTWPSLQACR